MPTRSELDAALARYPEALSLRANASKTSADLVQLDSWYRTDLRSEVHRRRATSEDGAKPQSWLSRDELSKLMQWKLAVRIVSLLRESYVRRCWISDSASVSSFQRGKWRPRLQDMVGTNAPEVIRASTSTASVNDDHEAALKKLSKLKAVGPATASAILALWYPDSEPFMSDEGLDYAAALGPGDSGKKLKRDYTVKAWGTYKEEMLDRKEREKWDSVEELEKALYSWAVLRKYGSEEGGSATKEEVSADEASPAKGRKRGAEPVPVAVSSENKKRKSS